MLLQNIPAAKKTAESMLTAYVDNFYTKRAEGECALLLHMMQLDSDNWYQPQDMLQMIRESRVRRCEEQYFVFKGVDNSDIAENVCRVKGEVLVSINQDKHHSTIFVPLLRD